LSFLRLPMREVALVALAVVAALEHQPFRLVSSLD
jgi:hypothetical protein